MTNRNAATLLLAPFALILSACEQGERAPQSDDQSSDAAGEILGGSISDEMINYEELESRAPTLKKEPESGSAESEPEDDAE